jgi:hypothetical protein
MRDIGMWGGVISILAGMGIIALKAIQAMAKGWQEMVDTAEGKELPDLAARVERAKKAESTHLEQ